MSFTVAYLPEADDDVESIYHHYEKLASVSDFWRLWHKLLIACATIQKSTVVFTAVFGLHPCNAFPTLSTTVNEQKMY